MAEHERQQPIVSPYQEGAKSTQAVFSGFQPPTSNTTYTPNQFFDVVMRHASRGCLRIVAYLIRQTLGWCDAQGNPQRERIEVSHRDIERRAGVSHDMIRSSLNEALAAHFIECVREGRASAQGDTGCPALFALKWDPRPAYIRELAEFRGFYEGEGHRTDIPNEFFDKLIPTENISVIKVVGSVIRYSIGFQAKHGRRRQEACLAYSQILQVSGLSSRRTLATAIRESIDRHYIIRIDPGHFSPSVAQRRSAIYTLRWSDGFLNSADNIPTTPKRIPDALGIKRSEKDTSESGDRSETATNTAPKRLPADHSEKEDKQIPSRNENKKQSLAAAGLLHEAGFDTRTAEMLAANYPLETIRTQIEWLTHRRATKSRVGLLRRAIEGNWPAPLGYFSKQARETSDVRRFASPILYSPASINADPEAVHFEHFHIHYLTWLAEQEAAFQRTQAADYARFKAKRDCRRLDIIASKAVAFREKLLSEHDSEVGRLREFQKFFGLPSFWEWDRDINSQSLGK